MQKPRGKASIALFATTPGVALAAAIGRVLGVRPGKTHLDRFNDGEVRAQMLDDVSGKNVFIVGPTHAPAENLLELALMADAARGAGAKAVTLVVPYLGYNRQDKRKPGKPHSARLAMDMLARSGASRIVVLDLHAAHTLEHFGALEVSHISAAPAAAAYFKKALPKPFVVASPDKGGEARASQMAKLLGGGAAAVFEKSRHDHGAIKKITTSAPEMIRGRHVLFVDDLIDSGGTLVEAALVAKSAGAKSVRAFATHAVLSGDALGRLTRAFAEVVLTDSIPRASLAKKKPGVTVLPLASLIAAAITASTRSRPSKVRAKSQQKSKRSRQSATVSHPRTKRTHSTKR